MTSESPFPRRSFNQNHLKTRLQRTDYRLSKPFGKNVLAYAMNEAHRNRSRSRNVLLFFGEQPPEALMDSTQRCRSTPWTEFQHISPNDLKFKSGTFSDPKIGSIWIQPMDLASPEVSRFSKRLLQFRRTPLGHLTPVICLGRTPENVFHYREAAQYFVEPSQFDLDPQMIFLQIQTRITHAWELGLLFQRAKSSLQQRDYKTAHQIVQTMLRLNSHHCDVQVLAGCVYEALGQTKEAASFYRRALLLNPCLPMPYLKLLHMRAGLNSEEGSLNALSQTAIRYCPRSSDLLEAAAVATAPPFPYSETGKKLESLTC
jgi:tetratricopeptide (TPR) repeat protein